MLCVFTVHSSKTTQFQKSCVFHSKLLFPNQIAKNLNFLTESWKTTKNELFWEIQKYELHYAKMIVTIRTENSRLFLFCKDWKIMSLFHFIIPYSFCKACNILVTMKCIPILLLCIILFLCYVFIMYFVQSSTDIQM